MRFSCRRNHNHPAIPPRMIYRIGFDTNGSFDQIISATAIGIQTVFQVIRADLAVVMTGAMMSATTAGRIPRKIEEITLLFWIRSGVKNTAMARITVKHGSIVPNAAATEPRVPRSLSPTATDMFTARIPGRDCDTASRSRNSSRGIHPL